MNKFEYHNNIIKTCIIVGRPIWFGKIDYERGMVAMRFEDFIKGEEKEKYNTIPQNK